MALVQVRCVQVRLLFRPLIIMMQSEVHCANGLLKVIGVFRVQHCSNQSVSLLSSPMKARTSLLSWWTQLVTDVSALALRKQICSCVR